MTATAEEIDDSIRGRSLWQDAWARLRRNRLAVLCMVLLTGIIFTCFIGPWFCPWNPEIQNLKLRATPPGTMETLTEASWVNHGGTAEEWRELTNGGANPQKRRHWFGTDTLGRDLLARTLRGGQVSLMVGLVATLVALIIGVAYGAAAGYAGGRTDDIMMRAVDTLRALPFMIFVILLTTMFEKNLLLIFLAIGAVEWLTMARIVRAQVLGLARQEFVDAARSLGLQPGRIIFRHIVPNVLGPVIVYATLTVPAVMLLEAGLSFLGLGVQAPDSSWGTLIDDGATNMESFWWLLVFPSAFFSLTLFCLNFAGDGLRDALDVKSAKD
ncbi:MAG TPA: ABC transporter permease subunit [Verrucomicrobiales bacterium]|nr:ABC transporter permease subunit [Verrucomicrobiales bacterium]